MGSPCYLGRTLTSPLKLSEQDVSKQGGLRGEGATILPARVPLAHGQGECRH